MIDALGAVASSSLFRGRTAEQCGSFASIACGQDLSKDDFLFRLGQRAGTLFIISRRVVQLTMPVSMKGDDREVVVLEARG